MPRLLLVDDDEPTRLILRRFLVAARPDLHVEEAANGEQAIAALKERAFDCVLSDYRMGLATGIDVLAFALQRDPGTTRILMTGFSDPMLERAAQMRAKVHGFIEKPMSTREFEALLREHLLPRLPAPPEG